MKKTIIRILSLVLMIATVVSNASLLTFANETEAAAEPSANISEAAHPSLLSSNILSFSCYYIPSTKTVNIKGTINYDAFALHRDSTIVIYSIPIGQNEYDIINNENSKPIAESPVSITFAFSFKLSSIIERYSRYAVFLRTADGEYILTTEPQYAETESKPSISADKDNFKGFSGNYISEISNANAKTVILPVYLDSIFINESSGYIYQLEKERLFFNETYVNELDSQIRSLSLFGSNVYLQFLLRQGGAFPTNANDNAIFAMPDTSSSQTVLMLHALTDFLTSRYYEKEFGIISGIILGKSWDNAPLYNSIKDVSFEEYVNLCGNYAAIVSNAARDINPDLNITLSFSGNGFFVEQETKATTASQFSSKELLTQLMAYFDESSYSGLNCSILIEAEETPLEITSEDIAKGINLNKALSENKFYIGSQKSVSEFLVELSGKYKSANEHYSIRWTPKKELRGNALYAAYSYAFYALLLDENIVSFITEFSTISANKDNFYDISHLFKCIDTEENSDVTQDALNLFNKNNWKEVFNVNDIPTVDTLSFYSAPVLESLPKKIKGEFSYFDFSQAYMSENWIKGVGVNEIKIDYLLSKDKALRSNLSLTNNSFCDLIYYYEYPENISYTPYISFDLQITSEKNSSPYEVKFIFKGNNAVVESSTIIKENQSDTIIIDMSKAKGLSSIESVKISVRCLDSNVESSTLWIRNIKGYSKKYNNNQLSLLIAQARNEQKNINNGETKNFFQRYIFVILITTGFAALGIVLAFLIQKNSRSKRKE